MSSSIHNSPNKRDWEQYNEDDAVATNNIASTTNLSLMRPEPSFYISPDKRNKVDNVYEFDGNRIILA
jgi:hypothetical protein